VKKKIEEKGRIKGKRKIKNVKCKQVGQKIYLTGNSEREGAK
jgi:hypothetical protein